MPIRVAVVGCGAVVQEMYKKRLQLLEKQGMIDVVGLVDRNPARLHIFQKHFKKASSFDNLTHAFEATGSQLAIITSPAAMHAEHAINAMRNRNHVICEKPMAVTEDQCQQMIDVSCQTGMKLSIGMIRRYFPAFMRAKRIIEDGEIGEVQSFAYREGRPYNWPIASPGFFQNRANGGLLLDMGSHVFDLLIWLFGATQIVSHCDDSMKNGIEASCITKMLFGSISGLVHLSWDYQLNNSLVIQGARGKITVLFKDIDMISVVDNEGRRLVAPDVAIPPSLHGKRGAMPMPRNVQDCIYVHLVQMLDAIMTEQRPVIGGCEALAAISAIEKCYQIAEPMEMSWLPAEQNSSFKNLHWRN